MKKQIHDEKETLDYLERHIFEDRKNNLDVVKKRLGLDDERQKRLKARFRFARLCYVFGCLFLMLGAGLYGGYRYFLELLIAKPHYISAQMGTNFYQNIQSEQFLNALHVLIAGSFVIFILLIGLGCYLKKSLKNIK